MHRVMYSFSNCADDHLNRYFLKACRKVVNILHYVNTLNTFYCLCDEVNPEYPKIYIKYTVFLSSFYLLYFHNLAFVNNTVFTKQLSPFFKPTPFSFSTSASVPCSSLLTRDYCNLTSLHFNDIIIINVVKANPPLPKKIIVHVVKGVTLISMSQGCSSPALLSWTDVQSLC